MKRLRADDDAAEAVLLLLLTRPAKFPYRERVLIPEFRLNILTMSDGEAKDQFRFTIGELTLLAKYLKLPDIIRTREGVRSSALDGLGVCLRRLMYPKRWIDMAAMFGRAPETLCSIFYFVVEFLDEKLAEFLFFDTPRIGSHTRSWSSVEAGLLARQAKPLCAAMGAHSNVQRALVNGVGADVVHWILA